MDVTEIADRFDHRDWQETEPDPDDPVRFAMIGLGWWTVEEAMPAVEAEDGLETTVLVSSTEEKAARVADETHTDATPIDYDAFHEGVASEAYDAVYICTPNALHLQYVETAAELDKAVLCEKPLEATAERARAIVEAAATTDAPVMTAYRMHTEPSVRISKQLIDEGVIGDPAAIHGHMTQPVLEIAGPDQWRLDPDLAGPGASVTDLGIYPLNTSRFVLEADPVAVTATMHSEHEAFDAVPDEVASFTAEFPDGVAASCTASQNAQQSGSFRVIGTDGELRLEPAFFSDDRRTLTLLQGGTETTIAFPTVDQMQVEFAYFADCLRAGRDPYPDAEHGLVDMRAIEAIYEAAAERDRIELSAGR